MWRNRWIKLDNDSFWPITIQIFKNIIIVAININRKQVEIFRNICLRKNIVKAVFALRHYKSIYSFYLGKSSNAFFQGIKFFFITFDQIRRPTEVMPKIPGVA